MKVGFESRFDRNSIDVHPAILTKDLPEFIKQVTAAVGYTSIVDIDIIDWSRSALETIGAKAILQQEFEILVQFDLMMDNPTDTVKLLIEDPRTERIIVNVDSKDELIPLIEMIHEADKKAGISLNPENMVEDFHELTELVEVVQIMTIVPGKQGNNFQEDLLNKVSELRVKGFGGIIGIDGGVRLDNAQTLLSYDIDYASVGSLISKSPDPATAFKQIQQILTR